MKRDQPVASGRAHILPPAAYAGSVGGQADLVLADDRVAHAGVRRALFDGVQERAQALVDAGPAGGRFQGRLPRQAPMGELPRAQAPGARQRVADDVAPRSR